MPRLERSATDRVISGVCGGLGAYLQVDPTFVRAFFVIAGILTAGVFVLAYVVLLVLMPLPGQRAPMDDVLRRTGDDVRVDLRPQADEPPGGPSPEQRTVAPGADRSRETLAYILIALGAVFLLANLGARFIDWRYVWPLILVALGVALLLGRARR